MTAADVLIHVPLILSLVLFGGSQIPKLARNLGRAQKEFKDGIVDGSRSASGVTDTTSGSALKRST